MTPLKTATLLLAIAVAMSAAADARAAVWVSASGDDRNPGTEEQPLRTIERARDVVRTLNQDMADDITVFVAGEYEIERPITFGPQDSGTNGFNIIYTAAPGEHPVITGGVRISGWAPVDAARRLWSAPVPPGVADPRDIFVSGTPAWRTKSRLLAVFSNPVAAPAAAPDPKAQWKNPGDVVFEPVEAGSIWSERTAPSPAFVENAFELLGKPGEWYLDRPARRIFYTPRPGEDLRTADVEAALAKGLVSGAGSSDKPISGLVFKGIRFEYTASAGAPDGAVASPQAAAAFTHASGIQFLEDDFLHLGTSALALGPDVEGGTIEGCLFADISSSAIRMRESTGMRITESRFSYTAVDHIHEGAIDVDASGEIAVDHDQFDHFPTVAVLTLNSKPGAVHRSSNWVTAPMLSLNGFGAHGPASIPAQEIGISEDYRALEDEVFASLTIPRFPASVAAEAEDEFAYVTWMPDCRDGGSPVISYTVESSGGKKTTIAASDFEQKGYITMNGLSDGHPVSFTVYASNAIGSGPASPPTANVTPRQKRKLRVPGAPASVSVTAGPAGLIVQITPPTSDGGSPVVSYIVSSPQKAEPIVIEGLDVIHADAFHPVSRTLAGFAPRAGSPVSVVPVNTAGEGKPAVYIIK